LERSKVAPIDDPDMQYLQEALLATPNYISSKRKYKLTLALSWFVLVSTIVATYLIN